MKINHAAILLSFLMYSCAAIDLSAQAKQLIIAEAGQTNCTLVVSADADVSDKAVAEDFADILKEITGATFEIVTDDSEPGEYEIIIGADNARLATLGLADLAKDFAQGEYEIRTIGNKLIIAGGPSRGTINGMYGFLQDHLGCRWFTPGCMKIPKQTTIKLGEIRDRQKPDFTVRTQNPQMHWDAAWTARNRINECKTGGGGASVNMLMSDDRVKTIGNYSSGHGMSYIPVSLFATHPEYYAKRNGKRVLPDRPRDRSYCMTSDGLAGYMADLFKKKLRGSKGRTFVGLGHPDNGNFCQCDPCQDSYERLGMSGTYMAFDHKVTEQLVADYPLAIVTTLAYGVSYQPPKQPMKLHPNLRVIWCPIGACYAHGFNQCDVNQDRQLLQKLAQWRQMAGRVQIWYYMVQMDALMPFLRMEGTAHNFKAFKQIGIEGIYGQDDADSSRRTEVAFDGDKLMAAYGNAKRNGYLTVPFGLLHLRGYLLSKMMWDADYDWQAGVREFCDTYYGPAGSQLAKFVLMVESVDSYETTVGSTFKSYTGVHQSISIAPKLKPSVVVEMNRLLAQAVKKTKDNKTYRRRVELARASVDLAILCFTSADSELRAPAFKRFFSLMEELGLKTIRRTAVSFDRKTLAQFKQLMLQPQELVIPGAEPVGANLLANSSFETATLGSGIPDSWQADGSYLPEKYQVDPAGVAIDTSKAYSGKQCMRLTKKPSARSIVALRQRFDVKPGERYRAKVRYQAQVTTGNVHMIFTAYNKSGQWLRHQAGTRGVKQTGDQWRELSLDTQAESDTTQMMIEFFFYNDKADGVAWIDDFQCARIQNK